MAVLPLYIMNIISFLVLVVGMIMGVNLSGGLISYALVFVVGLAYFIFKRQKVVLKFSVIDVMVILYFYFNLISFVNVMWLNKSYQSYFAGISYTLFPMLGYFVISFFKTDDFSEKFEHFLKAFANLYIILIAVGSFLYFIHPQYYVDYVVSMLGIGYLMDGVSRIPRMMSYFNSSIIGNLSCVAIPVLVYLGNKISRKKFIILSICILVGVVFSLSRSSWVISATILLLLVFFYRTKRLLVLVLSTALIGVAIFSLLPEQYKIMLKYKTVDITSAFDERNDQVGYAWSLIADHPLGMGLGQTGHKSEAVEQGHIGVTDNNYLRIFSELGVFGIFLFVSIIMLSYLSLFTLRKDRNLKITIGLILLIFCFQGLGTNVFDYHYSSYIIWCFIGWVSLHRKMQPEISKVPTLHTNYLCYNTPKIIR